MKIKDNHRINRFVKMCFNVFLILFMVICFDSSKAYANKQAPVRNLKIDTLSSTVVNGITMPSVAISWETPLTSSEIEYGANLLDGAVVHDIESYNIKIRNLSLNETSETTVGRVSALVKSYSIPTSRLKTGSLYTVSVYPVHSHTFQEGEITTYKDATYTSDPVPYLVFYTSPNIEVRTEGNGMVITFDDAGDWVYHKIFYEMLTENPFDNGYDEDKGLLVTKGSSNVRTYVENVNGIARTRIEYTLTGRSDIKAGKAYSVAIKTYDMPGDDYTVSISPIINVYSCATEAPFRIIEQSDEYLKLSWQGLNSVANRVKEVLIFSGSESGNLEQYARISNDNASSVEYYLIKKPEDTQYFQIKVTYSDDETVAYSKILEYNPDLSRIIPERPNIYAKYESSNLVVNWTAFYYQNQIRFDTYYDVLITDSVSLLENVDLNSSEDIIVAETSEAGIKVENTGMYTAAFNTYIAEVLDNKGKIKGYSSEKLLLNKVYYVRVIAKIKTTNGELCAEPTSIAVYIDSAGNVYFPPVMAKPPLNKRYVTENEISIGWDETWFEVMNKSYYSDWHSEVWYKDGIVSFTELEDEKHIVLHSVLDVNELKALINADSSLHIEDFVFRQVYFSQDTKYEGYITPYADVEKYIATRKLSNPTYSIEKYMEEINNSQKEDTWTELSVGRRVTDTGVEYYTNFNNLESNTLYFIMIRSYREFDDVGKIYSSAPSSIICITSSKSQDSEPVPTVPILSLEDITDIQMKVKWKYTDYLDYEIRYAKLERVEDGKAIIINTANLDNLQIEDVNNNYILTINDLFPNTSYYIWIKAKQQKGKLESAWSNALLVNTLDVLPSPILPPSGIGIASTSQTVTSSFLTVEWTRTQEDLEMDAYEGTTIIKNISYIFEIADNIKFLDYKEVETGALEPKVSADFSVIDKAIVRALNLKSSSRYYLRIKTRITVRDTETGDEIIKDSPYSIVKIFMTTSVNEYDSDLGNIQIKPAEKYETKYKTNEVIISVLNDERVINDLIVDGAFDYIIDFSKEPAKYKTKTFKMPLNVLLTLQRRDMNLVLKLDSMSISVPGKAFNNSDYQNLMKSGGIESLTIQIQEDSNIYFDSVEAKDINASFNTRYGNVAIQYLDDYMNAQFDITKSAYYGNGTSNVKAVIYNPKTARWDPLKEQYVIGYDLVFKTGKIGKIGFAY